MLPYFTEKFGNPSSVYSFASGNKEVIKLAVDGGADIGATDKEGKNPLIKK